MTVTDLPQIVPARLTQAVRNKLPRACHHQLVTCRRYQACWNNLLRVCWPHQHCYKMIPTCSTLVNNWEQAVRTRLVDKLWDFYAFRIELCNLLQSWNRTYRVWFIPTIMRKIALASFYTHAILIVPAIVKHINNSWRKFKRNQCLKGHMTQKLTLLFFSLIWKIIENCRVTSLTDFCFLASF
jgi:hypothetical protein